MLGTVAILPIFQDDPGITEKVEFRWVHSRYFHKSIDSITKLHLQASSDMEEIFQFIDNLTKRLSRGINDLDDVRGSMAALSEIREAEIRIEMTIGPIEESFALLNRYGLVYSSSDSERVDGLTYAWKKLLDQVKINLCRSHMVKIQTRRV